MRRSIRSAGIVRFELFINTQRFRSRVGRKPRAFGAHRLSRSVDSPTYLLELPHIQQEQSFLVRGICPILRGSWLIFCTARIGKARVREVFLSYTEYKAVCIECMNISDCQLPIGRAGAGQTNDECRMMNDERRNMDQGNRSGDRAAEMMNAE